jgi:hypothetical protein
MTDLPSNLDGLIEYVAERVDSVEMARIWYRELARIDTPEAAARRRMLGALLEVIDEQRETNRRLNARCQKRESVVAAVEKAVAEWDLAERGGKQRTYVPLHTLTAIAKAVGREFDSDYYQLHYQRVEELEARLARYEGN